ncbi:unnamed protein product [Ectocarpus fasciculatus]
MGEEAGSSKFPAINYADDGHSNAINNFPAINYADDSVADSPTMAEEMFSRRLGGGGGQPQQQQQHNSSRRPGTR